MADRAVRVLLVDDHPLVRAAVASTLAAASIEVVGEAGTAPEGLELALALRPDIVVLDIDLPGRAGLAILPELTARLPGTSVVMLTVSSAHQHLVQAIAAGASGYLTKDMSPEALVRAIQGVAAGDLAMSREAALGLVADEARRAPRLGALAQLTAREREVLELLATGLTDRAIGERLGVSPRTVETHVGNLLKKLRLSSRAAAVGLLKGERRRGSA